MTRLSIEITPEQHKTLKAMAALNGKTIKEYVLEQTIDSVEYDLENRKLPKMLEEAMKSEVSALNDSFFVKLRKRAKK